MFSKIKNTLTLVAGIAFVIVAAPIIHLSGLDKVD